MDASAPFSPFHLLDVLDGIRRLVMDTSLELENLDFKEVVKYLVAPLVITNLAAQIVMFEFILAYMKLLTRVQLNESIYFLKVMLMI